MKKDLLEAQINFPNLKLRIRTSEPTKGLREITRILHNMQQPLPQDDEVSWRLGYLSEDLRDNKECMDFIKNALRVEEGVRHRKVSMDNKKIIDLENKRYSSSLQQQTVTSKLTRLTEGMEKSNYVLLHVNGSVSSDEKISIVDKVKDSLPKTHVHAVFTNRELLGKTVVEALFFGSFPDEY